MAGKCSITIQRSGPIHYEARWKSRTIKEGSKEDQEALKKCKCKNGPRIGWESLNTISVVVPSDLPTDGVFLRQHGKVKSYYYDYTSRMCGLLTDSIDEMWKVSKGLIKDWHKRTIDYDAW